MPAPTREQFERLVHEHHAAVHRAALRVCADEAEAADVAQDVFVRVLAGKEHLAHARSERATLCWLATRLAANTRRSARRRQTHEENAMRTQLAEGRPAAPDPAAATERADLHRSVAQCVEELPGDLRVPLLLRCQDGLALAAIGTALRLPTSTVHDRVEQALQRLRAMLARRGHAVAAVALPDVLAGAEVPPGPAGLQARLLALGSPAAPVAAGVARRVAVAVLALAAAGALVVALPTWWSGAAAGAPPAVAALAVVPPAPAAQDPPPPPPPSGGREEVRGERPAAVPPVPAAPRVLATFTGTVRDAAAWPVAGAAIAVVAGGGYKPFEVGEPVTTDARGAFTIAARASWLDLRAVRLVVRESGRELLQTGDLVVPRPAGAAPLELVLPAAVGTATSRYECTVLVRDEAGQPLAAVPVALLGPTEPAPRPDYATREATGTTGADGRAVLPGRGLGPKWLFVDGRPLHRRSHFARIAIDAAGLHQQEVVLPAGAELTVLVTTVSGRALAWGEPWLEDESNGLSSTGEPQPDGSRLFCGLGPGPFTVHAAGDGRASPAAVRGVRPSAERTTIRLKERDDERDVGDHLAEIHGELFDAVTGEVVPYGAFQLEVESYLGGRSSLVFDGVLPPAPAQRAAEQGSWRRFHQVGLDAGRWIVIASVPGYALAGEVFELGANEVRTGVRIPLHKQAVVRGKVVDGTGQPLAGVSLFALGIGQFADAHVAAWQKHRDAAQEPGAREPSYHPIRGWSRKDGTFEVDQIPPGVPLRLLARHDQHGCVVIPLPPLRPGEVVTDFDVRLVRR